MIGEEMGKSNKVKEEGEDRGIGMDMEINPYFYSLMKHKLKKEQMKS
jgi:hypothetical protein